MNERIRELAEQAQKEVWGNSLYNGSPEFEGYELDAEKFAELIVLECIGAVDIPKHLNGEAEHYFREAAQLIRNHFGVKP
jgi:hypothetical protein